MLRQLQSVLMALQVVHLLHLSLATSTLLPMELYEIAHSHHPGDVHSDAISLHDLLVAEEHFQERTHPMAHVKAPDHPAAPGLLVAHEPQPATRRHRKSTTSGSRRRGRTQQQHQHRQGRQMVSHESALSAAAEPKIYYAMGVSKQASLLFSIGIVVHTFIILKSSIAISLVSAAN